MRARENYGRHQGGRKREKMKGMEKGRNKDCEWEKRMDEHSSVILYIKVEMFLPILRDNDSFSGRMLFPCL